MKTQNQQMSAAEIDRLMIRMLQAALAKSKAKRHVRGRLQAR